MRVIKTDRGVTVITDGTRYQDNSYLLKEPEVSRILFFKYLEKECRLNDIELSMVDNLNEETAPESFTKFKTIIDNKIEKLTKKISDYGIIERWRLNSSDKENSKFLQLCKQLCFDLNKRFN